MDEWIGPKFRTYNVNRKRLLAEVKKVMMSPTPPQPMITTDLKNPEGVPEFVLDLERDVYKEGYTVFN